MKFQEKTNKSHQDSLFKTPSSYTNHTRRYSKSSEMIVRSAFPVLSDEDSDALHTEQM